MGVRINETGYHHMTGCVNGLTAFYSVLGNDGDAPIPDTDIANFVKVGLGVHHPAVSDDDVIFLCYG